MAAIFEYEFQTNLFVENGLQTQIDYINRLSSDKKESIKWYTLEGNAQRLNKILRQTNGNPRFISDDDITIKHHLQNLDSIFKGIPPLKNALTVYRGIQERFTENYSTHSFISTTLLEDITLGFINNEDEDLSERNSLCCVLRITVNPGAKVIPAIPTISRHPNEIEVILDRDFNFSLNRSYIERSAQKNIQYYDMSYSNGVMINSGQMFTQVIQTFREASEAGGKNEVLFDEVVKFKIDSFIKLIKNRKDIDDKILHFIKNINQKRNIGASENIINDVLKKIKHKYEKDIDSIN